jgi:hypothetical protein
MCAQVRLFDPFVGTRRFNARTGRVSSEWAFRNRHLPRHLPDCEAMQAAVALNCES